MTMEKLSAAIGILEEKLAQLELLVAEEREKGRQAHARKASKHLVAGHVRAMKALEAQHVNVVNMKTNLVERLIAEESAAIVKTYTDAMGGSLKKKGVNIDQLQKTLDTVADRMDDASEVQELVSEPLTVQDLDDEISALFGNDVPDDVDSLPPPPSEIAPLPEGPKQPISAEEKALEAALKGITL